MIRVGSRRHSNAALLLHRLSIGHDQARRRAALDNRLVGQSPLCDADFCLSRSANRARHSFDRFPKRRSTHLGN
jgi:hypothetical protein